VTPPKSFIAWLGLGLAALLSVLLASCGGGSTVASSGGVGTGGTGMSFGTVTGFGSVVLDGTPYNSAAPRYFAGSDLGDATPTAATAVQLGNQLRIALDAQGTPSMVLIEPELMGPVANLTPAGFSVNGVAVQVNTNPAAGPVTYYSGLTDYTGLSMGMQVEVHGASGVDANGQNYVQATLIEQLPATSTVTCITGIVSRLQAASGTFQIGATTVQLGAATSITPAGQSLADGQLVHLWSQGPPSAGGTLLAGVVRIRTLQGVGGPVQVGGLVSQLSGSRLQVAGVTVDAGAPALAAAVQGLVLGEYVVVQGQANATTGVLTASSLRAYATRPAEVELRGTITGFVSPGNFLVRGVPVDASGAGVVFNAGSAASLGNGVFVDIFGQIGSGSANVVTASRVTVLAHAPDGGTVDYQGTVSALNMANGTFTLTWQQEGATNTAQVTLAPNVAFSNGAAAQLVNGANVEIEATRGSSTAALLAYSVTFQGVGSGDGTSASTRETQGVVYNLSANTFQLNALTILINGVTPSGGALANGAKVEVAFTTSGTQNLAYAISIDH
jgi:hypothetical protein